PAQQKNYRSNLTQALKVLDPNHPAIERIALSTETYRELNDLQRGRLADRETKFFTSAAAEILVERATAMLDNAEWSIVAAGLAVLIGRRISEILLSDFAPHSAWSLSFSNMAKKAQGDAITIEIPTLAPADRVLAAITQLQAHLRIDDLRLEAVSDKGAKQRVNSRYSEAVARRCDQYFGDLIPTRTDRESLYTHVFRAVYATIAAHWFCPPTVPEYSFKAEIQGHFTISSTGQKLPNHSARANYDDYAIGTPDGNRDGRLGIKLGMLPGLEIIDAFRKPQPTQETQSMTQETTPTPAAQPETAIETAAEPVPVQTETAPEVATPTEPTESAAAPEPTEKRRTKHPKLYAEDVDRMMALMLKRGITGAIADVFQTLLDTFEQQAATTQQQQLESMGEMGKALNRFLDKIEVLETTVSNLQAERDQLQANQEQLAQLQDLQAENQRLRSHLEQVQAELADPRKMLERVLAQQSISPTPTEPIAPKPAPASPAPIAPGAPRRSPPPKPQAEPAATRGDKAEIIDQIIEAMISYNTSQERTDTMLRISFPAIKGIASAMGASYQTTIQEGIKARQADLEALHNQLKLGKRHNATVPRKNDLLQSIARENLGLENWEEVKFP
ncbi:MAG: hypothetical protein F6K28_41660, partial [Microcoleus sp. SIO2G3]|nr:hypothetical protein [Microcoleus sp. SIO2G3]